MNSTTCAKCRERFKFPYQLRRHEQRKTPCDQKRSKALPSGRYQCKGCLGTFSTASNLAKHRRHCKEDEAVNKDEQIEKLAKENTDLKEILRVLLLKIDTDSPAKAAPLPKKAHPVEEPVKTVASKTVEATAQGHHNNVAVDSHNTTNNVTINVFGKENIDHITPVEIMQLMRKAEKDNPGSEQGAAKAAIIGAIMILYSDEKHPENITCFMPNIKGNGAMVHKGDGWRLEPMSQVVPMMAKEGTDTIYRKQPFPAVNGVPAEENVDDIGKMLRYILDHEKTGLSILIAREIPTILYRNKKILERRGGVPKEGDA